MTSVNAVGLSTTTEVSYVLAAVPEIPTTIPTLNLEFTTVSAIQVDMAPLLTSENGGSEILSYELSIYNTTLEEWNSITGGESQFSLLSTHIYSDGI